MSDAIFIVGYYRSGTSALSGALQRFGVKFYNEADPNEHNPLGFYEIPELIGFDVDLFNRLGVDWTDVRGLPPGWADRADLSGYLSRLEEIVRRRFSQKDKVWGLKHPHLCRTLPIYERAARQAGHKPHVVHIFRDPWTAAASQQRKNGLTRAHALLLWMSYLTTGERQARHLPRSWLTYQDLLTKPAEELRRIEQDAGLALSHLAPDGVLQATNYLTGQLNRSEPFPRKDLCRPLRELVTQAWEAIQARDFTPALWDGFVAETADLVGFLTEIGASRGRVIPALGGSLHQAPAVAGSARLRPPERVDEGGEARLLALRAAAGELPRLSVIIVAAQGRAHAVNDTLESLRAQWEKPANIKILAAEALEISGTTIIAVPPEPEAMTRLACAELNNEAATADYVAIINAGDTVAPDACLRFALLAAESGADMIYSDEIVPREGGAWVRHKPGWDITRLRQAAYIGDWVWYGAKAVQRLGGFDQARAGAEEFDFQLRLAEINAKVERLPEALFTRAPQSRRDDIKAEIFCARAAEAVKTHLARAAMPAEVQNRQHLGLFHHMRAAADPGTSIVMLCDGGEIPALDRWLKSLLTGPTLTGPVILAGVALNEGMRNYLNAVKQQSAALEGKVLAVPPVPELTPAEALRQALAMVATPYVAVLDVRAEPVTPHWQEALRMRLADPGVAMAAARTLVPSGPEKKVTIVQGPIIIGADTRLGAGHTPENPGPGGWLLVDQEASAVAPPGLLARTRTLAACVFPPLSGDALWIDLGAQLRAQGARLVWTPDVSFVAPPEAVLPDAGAEFRQGSGAARELPWVDPYHHPALSLHGDLLASETRTGLVPATPADPCNLLVTGAPGPGAAVLNAARALRHNGVLSADWAPELPSAADLRRRAPAVWVRINPLRAPNPFSPEHAAVFSVMPEPDAKPALEAASRIYGTSPALVTQLRRMGPPGHAVELWRPALSSRIWSELKLGTGLNTKPRILWVDEGIAPPWFTDLISNTLQTASWIIVERPGGNYAGAAARLKQPETELAWAKALAELGPHIMVRPANMEAYADHYKLLLGAAAGCHLLVDDRLDVPEGLGAVRLKNRLAAWQDALKTAIADLTGTLAHGQRARKAALALTGIETELPPWAEFAPVVELRSAAE
jgi:hypothetical protein